MCLGFSFAYRMEIMAAKRAHKETEKEGNEVLTTHRSILSVVELELKGVVGVVTRATLDAVQQLDGNEIREGKITRLKIQQLVQEVTENLRWVDIDEPSEP